MDADTNFQAGSVTHRRIAACTRGTCAAIAGKGGESSLLGGACAAACADVTGGATNLHAIESAR